MSVPSNLFDIRFFRTFASNQVAQISIFVVLCLGLTLSYSISVVSGILLTLALPLGAVAFNVLWTTKAIESLSPFDVAKYTPCFKVESHQGCTVCGDSTCKRQKLTKDNQPWLGLFIPKDVDQAIQDLFNKILNEFVTTWHGSFTKDEAFVTELRRCLRYASSIVLKRLLQVDIGSVVTDQLLTIGLRHVNDFLLISQLSLKEKISIEAAAARYHNKGLHFAVRSRKSELQYLRCLSDLLSSHLVQGSNLKCLSFNVLIRELLAGWVLLPLTDALCDPFCINSLILLALNHDHLTKYPDDAGVQVQFLQKFVSNKENLVRKSVLQVNLATILNEQKSLYTFMQFLKKEGVIHLLQFCLHVEEFSKKILNPELNQMEMENLYKEAWDLFSIYFKTDSPDNIHFPNHIVEQMEQILEYGAGNISRLLTNPVLFEAYEVAYANLEETYCPLFYLSDEYFQLLCGEKEAPKSTKGNIRTTKRVVEGSVVGKITNKFNKLLQFQAVEGKAYYNDGPLDLGDSECAEVLEVESLPEASLRDMSTWKVTVPYVTTKQDSNSKPYPVFNINVTNIVMGENSVQSSKYKWNVERRFNDFYILQAKLAEFHGDFEDTQLPPKTGMFSPRGNEFLENRRQLFEEYLQKLLQKPSLRGSDLLYFFLHSQVEFSSCLSVQYGIGRILRKSVEPIKLRKERGQRLENFLNVFLTSAEGSKKPGKYEWQDINVEQPRKKRDITKSIFNNNFEQFLCKTEQTVNEQKESLTLVGPWDCLLYILSKLMGASFRLIQAVVTVKNLMGQSSDLFLKKLIRDKLVGLLVSARVSHLVRLLQDALFNSSYQPGKQGHKLLRERITLEVNKTFSSIFIRWFLPKCSHGIETMVDSLQFPILNKHLCYCLLDEVVRILFPEVAAAC
ncbi:hypothetical protein RUM44_010788 [Polyplax serrata]|uniref:Sorting nexin 14 n=1 Tax=Polyplax serrata TaxID=468196 RepID=A0ABR1AN89_POLSC